MELVKHTKAIFKALKRQLRRYGKSPEPETLHKIRVEIKKIKAVLRLTDSCTKNFHVRRHFVPLRLIFRKAGRIREPELIYGLLSRYEITDVPDSLVPQSLMEDALSKEFHERIPSYITTVDKREEKIRKYLCKIPNRDVSKYLKKKKGEFRSLVISKWNRGTLHKARKVAKEIIYLSAVTKKTRKDLDPFYNKMQGLTGQWRDKQLLMPIVKASSGPDLDRLKHASQAERTEIKRLVFDFCG